MIPAFRRDCVASRAREQQRDIRTDPRAGQVRRPDLRECGIQHRQRRELERDRWRVLLERPRDLGCCLGDGPADRGCLPKADPPSATLSFEDAASGETLKLRYPMSRELQLRRRTAGGETLYWCHGWEHAPLRGESR